MDLSIDEDNPVDEEARQAIPDNVDLNDIYPPIEIPALSEEMQTDDSNVGRLMITHIMNENFKSYAGKRSLGPFHKNFTCIIGPNGSGKSNVIDSMLFVFGFRASKIRSKKLSVLIHKSTHLPDLYSCTVEVHFQKIIDTGNNDNDYEIIPDSHLVVARTAYRDNSSNFTVNGVKKTFKEVGQLLRQHGIDLDHNRFLILQGEVEQISLMKPKAPSEHEDGLLEYLEDIIGSSRFKHPIDTLIKRIEALNDSRQEHLNRVKVTEREKSELEGVRNEALDYLDVCNQITVQKNILYQIYLQESRDKGEASKAKWDEMQTTLQATETLAHELETEIADKNKLIDEKHKECSDLNDIYTSNKEQFHVLEAQDTKLRDEFKHTKNDIRQLTKSLAKEKEKIEELKHAPEEAAARIKDLEKQLEKLKADKAKEEAIYEEAMASLQDETKDLRKSKEVKETALNEVQVEVDKRQSAYQMVKSELELLLSNFNREQRKFDEQTALLQSAEQKINEKHNQLSLLEEEYPKMQQKLNQAHGDIQKVQEKEKEIVDQVRSLRSKLEESRNAMHSDTSSNQVLNALMEQTAAGRIPGVCGRLGDLGGIDEKYDVAISTACGRLDNIVTDTIDTAQKCVQFLKQHNLGQAQFIGLDKMEVWRRQAESRIQTPENVPRLYDLVRVNDKRFAPVFYFALRDTLVADNLDQATRIAYGATRYRVVTLQGQIIETSGAMSGGGGRPLRGRMGQKARNSIDPQAEKAAVENMEKELSERSQAVEKLRHNRATLEESTSALEKDVKEVKRTLTNAKAEMTRLDNQASHLRELLKHSTERLENARADPKKVASLEKDVDKLKKEHDVIEKKAIAIKNEVDDLHEQIMDIGGSKMTVLQNKMRDITNAVTQTNQKLTKINVSVKTADRNIIKGEEKCVQMEEDTEKKKARLEEIKSILEKNEVEANRLMAKFNDAQKASEEMGEHLVIEKEKLVKIEKTLQEHLKSMADIRHEGQEIQRAVENYSQRIKHWKKQINKLTLHRITEDRLGTMTEEERQAQQKLKVYTKEELEGKTSESLGIPQLEDRMKAMKPNMAAIEEYRRKEELYIARFNQLQKITVFRDSQRTMLEECKKKRLGDFIEGFTVITGRLKEMYQMITLGGDAELELVDSLDPFSEGIVFSVRPPKKSWKNISNLSGGEKTLSSLALVFALHHYKPTPLYVMDEIDAALDFKNVSIVANYIKERTKNAQFVIISLRSNMFELADRLVGIYKTFNCTKTVTVNPKSLQKRFDRGMKIEPANNNANSQPLSNLPINALNAIQSTYTSEQRANNIFKNTDVLSDMNDTLTDKNANGIEDICRIPIEDSASPKNSHQTNDSLVISDVVNSKSQPMDVDLHEINELPNINIDLDETKINID